MKKAILNWSGGKDCAYALYLFRKQYPETEIRLLTSITEKYKQVSMHGTREQLIDLQADLMGLKIDKVYVPVMPDNATYENLMMKKYELLKNEGFLHVIFGDIFLEDLRAYREAQMRQVGMKALFPLWKMKTADLARQFIGQGFEAIIISGSDKFFNRETMGSLFDDRFLGDLPKNVDPCGENGEFHTLVFNGPIFSARMDFYVGETVKKYYPSPTGDQDDTGFWFLDVKPAKVSR